jgi:FtsZ-binding cell division protein ZapB
MTIIGKILTVFLFLFSLLFLGFAVTINQLNKDSQTGKSWYTIVNELKAREKDYQADLRARSEELAGMRAKITTLEKEKATAAETAVKELDQRQKQIERLSAESAALKDRFAAIQADLTAMTAELERRRAEATKLYDNIKQLQTEISELQVKVTTATNEKTQAIVAADTFRKRAEQLEIELQKMTTAYEDTLQKLNQQKSGVAAPGAERRATPPPVPPPEHVEGVIKQVSADGLVSISIGSDAGLVKGHTLEVFRLNPTRYLGRITIVEVSPHEAVGKMQDLRKARELQVNDIVASQIVK